jgi:hypothetical protein
MTVEMQFTYEALGEEIEAWLHKRPLQLQKPVGTALHKLVTSSQDDQIITFGPEDGEHKEILDHNLQTFLLEHDWAGAFQNSNLIDEAAAQTGWGPTLPYDHCCFEFQISGKRLCVIDNYQASDEEAVGYVCVRSYFLNSSFGWVHLPLLRELESELPVFVDRQLQAALIALDTAVALTTIIRQPETLNRGGNVVVNCRFTITTWFVWLIAPAQQLCQTHWEVLIVRPDYTFVGGIGGTTRISGRG